MHLFDVLVRLASGPLLARRDAFVDKCALDSSMKASRRVQPLESSTLFGSKIPEVAKCYKEDLTRRSLQRATAPQPLPKKKKKTGAKPEVHKLVVNSSEKDSVRFFPNRQLPPKLIPIGLENLKGRKTRIKNRGAPFCQVCPDSLESSGSIK